MHWHAALSFNIIEYGMDQYNNRRKDDRQIYSLKEDTI